MADRHAPTAYTATVPLLLGSAGAILGLVGAAKGSGLALAAGVLGLAAGLFGARDLFGGNPTGDRGGDALATATAAARPLAAPVTAPLGGSGSTTSPSMELPDRGRGPAGGIHDTVTGLFNEHYFAVAVDSRVAAARRHLRPVAVIQLAVTRPGAFEMADPVAVSNAVRATLRDSDTACRMDDGRFAIILEDTPEEGAILTAERLRRAMGTAAPDHVQRAGIACYPAHAFNAAELLTKAERALHAARDWPQHRIEVAAAD